MSSKPTGSSSAPPSSFPPCQVSRVEASLVQFHSGFMMLELSGGKQLSFPAPDASTERACLAALALGHVSVVLEMRDEVPMKVITIEARGHCEGAPPASGVTGVESAR